MTEQLPDSRDESTEADRYPADSTFVEKPPREASQVEQGRSVTVPREQFPEVLNRAAEHGTRHAPSEVRLDGPEAGRDIREVRDLLHACNATWKATGLTVARMLVTGLAWARLAAACEAQAARGRAERFRLLGGHMLGIAIMPWGFLSLPEMFLEFPCCNFR